MYTPILLCRHSSRWRAAADVGGAVSGRAAAPDESTVQAASAVRMAPDTFPMTRARIGVAWSELVNVGDLDAEDHRVQYPIS